jgi:hypothetical protein
MLGGAVTNRSVEDISTSYACDPPCTSELLVRISDVIAVVMGGAVSRGSHPHYLLLVRYLNFYCKRMSASGRSPYRGSLPVICFRSTTSWAASRAVHVCVCAESDLYWTTLPCWRCLFIHVCQRVRQYVATWRRLGRFLSLQGYLRVKVYVLQVG